MPEECVPVFCRKGLNLHLWLTPSDCKVMPAADFSENTETATTIEVPSVMWKRSY